ncbi:MAG: hypothetical protein K1Y36_12020 [Blastocatellia bacterium]|nr:hypothetical protein [Blastocatellia bacterium]
MNELALVDVVQIFCIGRKNVTVSLRYSCGEVILVVADGNVIDAHYKNLRGKQAFFRAIAIDQAHPKRLQVTDLKKIPVRTIFEPWKKLIFHGLKKQGFGVLWEDFFPNYPNEVSP